MKSESNDAKRLEDMRRQLYARSSAADAVEEHRLTDMSVDVSRNWTLPEPVVEPTPPPVEPEAPVKAKTSRRYRLYILYVSLFIFIFGAGLSSLYLYFGGNEISSDNIAMVVDGPYAIGGGEVLDLSISITNQNAIAMESATLIVKYPQGTRSVGDSPRNLFEQRIPIESLMPGDSRTVPLQVVLFGEEQSEQQITATIEYRVTGSNSVFYKQAEPYNLSISSSPIVLRVQNKDLVSSGEAVSITLTVVSNSSSPQRDLLIGASYPSSFRFESADPAPVFGNTVWSIDELLPEESVTITLNGVMTGFADESLRVNFDLGPAQPNDPFIIDSLLAEARADFSIESPFIEIVTNVNGDETSSVVLEEGDDSRIQIEVINTLDSTVYDMMVEVHPGGNVLTEDSIQGADGFYDSNSGVIRWQASNDSSFAAVGPGERRRLSFTVLPANDQPTAAYDLTVNVYASRVAPPGSKPQLVGTALIEAKFNSAVFVGSQAGRGTPFISQGSLPPQVGQVTSYTLTIVAEAGANDLTDAIVSSALPIYVVWRDSVVGDGELIFNSVSQQLEWRAGNVSAGQRKQVSFQVSLTPSVSQVGSTPMLLQTQTMRATDRFTGSRLQATSNPVYTELSTEAGFDEDNGIVVR